MRVSLHYEKIEKAEKTIQNSKSKIPNPRFQTQDSKSAIPDFDLQVHIPGYSLILATDLILAADLILTVDLILAADLTLTVDLILTEAHLESGISNLESLSVLRLPEDVPIHQTSFVKRSS